MKKLKFIIILILLNHSILYGAGNESSFARVKLNNDVQVDLPRTWTYLDKNIADHLNTTSEAISNQISIPLNQSNNEILVAANAYDSQGKSKATFRISSRKVPSLTQLQMKEIAEKQSKTVESELYSTAEKTARALPAAPGIRAAKVLSTKIDRNNNLVCLLTSIETITDRGPIIMDTWICPSGTRTIKLSTSYHKNYSVIYQPIIHRIWRSLTAI